MSQGGRKTGLIVIETHPIQYHAPVYRTLQQDLHIPVTVVYGSDFSVAGYRDREFEASFSWDVDLLEGYESVFVDQVGSGGPTSVEELTGQGLSRRLKQIGGSALLLMGYSPAFHRRAIAAGLRSGLPLLFRAETTDHARARNLALRILRDMALRNLYRRCQRLLYIGKNSLEHYRRLGCPEHKLVFSPYCVDTAAFQTDEKARRRLRTETRNQLGISGGERMILYSGKLSERKGVLHLLAATKTLAEEQRGKVHLVFLGNGELRPEIEDRARHEPQIKTTVTGFKNQRELSPYYHSADLLVLPSIRAETWGLVVNEALHHGIPCVVSDGVGCAPDLVDEPTLGSTYPAGSVEGLAHALLLQLSREDGTELREIRRDRADAYSVRAAAHGIAEAYKATVNL
jgi:glycosyltransferase involved in cell wall biosynthesis